MGETPGRSIGVAPADRLQPQVSDPNKLELSALRGLIDTLDDRMLALLAERSEVVAAIAESKRTSGVASLDPEREKAVLERLVAQGAGRFPASGIVAVFREVMSASVAQQAPVTVACLGPAGTWTETAARTLFGFAPRYLEETAVEAVFDAVRRGAAEYGVVPVENSTEGSVSATLDALLEGGTAIRRELVLPIEQCLLTRASGLAEVARVYSHPQALAQCRRWLAMHLPRAQLVHTSSTSLAAAEAASDAEGAAIGSARAGELAGMPVLRAQIQDRSDNATRFVAIAKTDAPPTGDDKTTLAFGVRDDGQRGALRRVLALLDDGGVNLTRIESRPSPTEAWRYVFVVDVEGHRTDVPLALTLGALERACEWVRVLGSYPRFRASV